MILSPAKTLDLTPLSERIFAHSDVDENAIETLSKEYALSLCDEDKTDCVVEAMKKRSESELKTLLKLSPALAKSSYEVSTTDPLIGLTYIECIPAGSKTPLSLNSQCLQLTQYWSTFDMSQRKLSTNYAVFTFHGPAYQQGIIPQNCNLSTLTYLAKNLYILDPVYGVLNAMDKMSPYRLEMGCKGIVDIQSSTKKETLSTYWKDSITSHLSNQLTSMTSSDGSPILANLASEEYSSSVDIAALPRNTIFLNVIFKHKGRVIAVHAKRARGLMARYIAENDVQSWSDIRHFDLEGYACMDAGELCEDMLETAKIVGDNVRIVNMSFDRDDVPSSGQKLKRNDDGSDGKSSSKRKKN